MSTEKGQSIMVRTMGELQQETTKLLLISKNRTFTDGALCLNSDCILVGVGQSQGIRT